MAIGVIGALDEEVQLICDNMAVTHIEEHLRRTFYVGNLAHHRVIAVRSGVGKVRAAACTQFLIDHFSITRLIVAGIAGALAPELSIGDLIVSQQTLQWDFQPVGAKQRWHPAEPKLVTAALEAAKGLGYRARVGSVLTGDQPVITLKHKQELWHTYRGDCVEMEGAAVAHVCSMSSIPFVLIRVISDLADENAIHSVTSSFASVVLFPARVVVEMIKQLD